MESSATGARETKSKDGASTGFTEAGPDLVDDSQAGAKPAGDDSNKVAQFPPSSKPKPNLLPFDIKLASEESNLFHWIIENLVLFKWQWFKNRPRANYLVIRAVMSVFTLALCVTLLTWMVSFLYERIADVKHTDWHVFGILIKRSTDLEFDFLLATKIFGGFFGAVTVAFWKMSELYRQQWHYCCALYNDALKCKGHKNQLLVNALAIDLTVVDLWAHRSFKDVFRAELWIALCAEYESRPWKLEEIVTRINAGTYTEKEALEVLEQYQGRLL